MKKEDWYRYILAVVILICLVLLFLANVFSITGHATEGSTYSNVTIQKYLAISFSTNLSDGILFGDIATLPAVNINATHNYDDGSDGSTMYIAVSNDSNTPVDFCTKGNDDLTSIAADTIGLANETYHNSTTTDITNPDVAAEISLTTSYVKSGNNVAVGTNNYYRFWLDIPVAQPSGSYNNTVSFKGVTTGVSC